MTYEQTGDPTATGQDFTTRAEDRIENVITRVKERVGDLMGQVPRPVGSEPVDKVDDLEEYILTIAQAPDPAAALQRRLEERQAEGYSLEQAATWGLEWVKQNEKRIMDAAEKGRL